MLDSDHFRCQQGISVSHTETRAKMLCFCCQVHCSYTCSFFSPHPNNSFPTELGNRNKASWLWFLCEKQRYLLRSCRRASLFPEPGFMLLLYNNTSIAFGFLHALGKFSERDIANTTEHHISSLFRFSLISFPVERRKVMARPRNALACKRGIHLLTYLLW